MDEQEKILQEEAKNLLGYADDLKSEDAREDWKISAEFVIIKHRLFEIIRGRAI